MLRISKKADYAVFLLGLIAQRGAFPGGPASARAVVSAHEIARQTRLNKSVVANLLKGFARQGILQSTRGLKGGYRLTRSPRQVTLDEILTVVDGPFSLVDCLREPDDDDHPPAHTCNLIDFCPSKGPMRVVHERIAKLFDEITLAEMCGLQRLEGCPDSPSFSTHVAPEQEPAAGSQADQPRPTAL